MYLVTGATGHVGRPLVARLAAAGEPVRAFCRHPERGAFPSSVELAAGDISDPEAARRALQGVTRLFLMRAPGVEAFWDEVLRSGVQHVVVLSSGAVASGVRTYIGDVHRQVEDMVRQAPVTFSFLRPGAFMSNALQWAAAIRADGVVRAPFGDVPNAPVDARDLADAAAHLLRDPEASAGQIHPITGPELLTVRRQVAILQDVLGRPLGFADVPDDMAEQQMKRFAPQPIVDSLFAMMHDAAAHPNAELHPLTQVTGQPARTFAQWAEDHRAAFA